MPNIIKIGTMPERVAPWYEATAIQCDRCESMFLLDELDFRDGAWVERQEKTPGGAHTVEGNCPVCDEPMLVDVRALLEKGGKNGNNEPSLTLLNIAAMGDGNPQATFEEEG